MHRHQGQQGQRRLFEQSRADIHLPGGMKRLNRKQPNRDRDNKNEDQGTGSDSQQQRQSATLLVRHGGGRRRCGNAGGG